MIREEDFIAAIKVFMDSLQRLTEQQTAIGNALIKKGVVTQEEFQAALDAIQMSEKSRKMREEIEKVSVLTLFDILKGFEGPIQ